MYPFFRYKRSRDGFFTYTLPKYYDKYMQDMICEQEFNNNTILIDVYDGQKVNLPDGSEVIIPKVPYIIEGRKISCMLAQIIKQCKNKWALVEMKNGDKIKLYVWEVKLPKSISGFRFDGSDFIWEEYTLDLVKTITC